MTGGGSVRVVARAALMTVGVAAGLWTMTTRAEAAAPTVTVCASGCTYTTLAGAVSGATAGEVIQVKAGAYAGGFVVSTPLTIVGDGAWRTTIRGGVSNSGTVVAINANPVTIRGVSITGGTAPDGSGWLGSGVITNGGAVLNLIDSNVSGNQAGTTGGGGGINSYGTTNVVGCVVSDNQAGGVATPGQGGGFHVGGSGVLNIRDTLINNNSAGWGGAIDIDQGGTASLASTAVLNNTAMHQGGGVDDNGSLSITRSLLVGNAALQAGALMDNGTASVSQSLILFNRVSGGLGSGGGAYVTHGSTLTIGTTFLFQNSPDEVVRA